MADEVSVEIVALNSADEEPPRHTRMEALERAVVAGGALLAGGVLITGLPRLAASAPSPKQDAEILNFALMIERLQAAFYAEGLRRARLGGRSRQFARVVAGHERAHGRFIESALGSKAREHPRFRFGETTSDPAKFIAAAVALEDTALAAYNGQGPNLTASALGAAARIVSVEARHAAWARVLASKNPAPLAVDRPASPAEARAALKRSGLPGG
jgi:Ferritin-like domain